MPYAVDDIIEEHHSPASDKADSTGNQQNSRLWLIAARARRLRACACAVPFTNEAAYDVLSITL